MPPLKPSVGVNEELTVQAELEALRDHLDTMIRQHRRELEALRSRVARLLEEIERQQKKSKL